MRFDEAMQLMSQPLAPTIGMVFETQEAMDGYANNF